MARRAVAVGVGRYLPARIVSNAELEKSLDTSDEWIRTRSGIERRHIAEGKETTSWMGAEAAKQALAYAKLDVGDIDAIILATSTADLTFPSAATLIQAELGMTHGFAFDVQAVCAGFVYAMTTANLMILSSQAERVLVIGSETFSKIMDWTDRSTCVLFGDGAGAVVLESQEEAATSSGIIATDLRSDGRYSELLYVDGGVSTQMTGYLRMNGGQVFRHAIEKLADTAETALQKAGLTADDVDWLVPHQANIRIIHGTARKLNVPTERILVTVQDHGNTSAASIPLALSVGVESGCIKSGDILLTEAIGGGLAWGSVILRW
ncbi:MAG: ketoacyl-ACP synthase III [Aestuariivita sp.]|nr:ketoacyl-ACP synthase III [Aestuariivita sp.]MCY4203282.1 ketoacyl-ACP synthase III [Aestuariivita sp.]MCY4287191.1 ketoacyl-ACP synthase III [Aestuariivita sp.]MCY4347501.1 ketoacyl-ACP synthase III [Aestuariivita sp.]